MVKTSSLLSSDAEQPATVFKIFFSICVETGTESTGLTFSLVPDGTGVDVDLGSHKSVRVRLGTRVRLWLLVPVGDEDALENEEDFEQVALYSFTLHDGTE